MKKIVFLIAAVFTLSVFTGCDAFSEYEEILPETEQEETSDDTKPEDEDKADSDDPSQKDPEQTDPENNDPSGDPENPSDPDPSEPEPPAPPLEEKGMPVIYITPESGNTDFVTEPIAESVPSRGNAPIPEYEKCTITVIDKYNVKTIEEVKAQVKVRGNYTTTYPKKGLRIKFDKKQTMLDLHGGKDFKNWVLLAEYKDWSMLRNSCAFKMAKIIDSNYYASDFQPVNVYIRIPNTATGELEDVYWGVYLLAEQQEIKEDRISITDCEKNDTNTEIGYLLEFDSYADSETEYQHFNLTMGSYQKSQKIKDMYGTEINVSNTQFNKKYTIKNDVYSAGQRDYIKAYMNNVWLICYNAMYQNKYQQFKSDYSGLETCPSGTTCQQCIEKVIDVDSLVAAYVLSEIACDPDLYYSSFYMDVDLGPNGDKKLRFEAPWDFDSTMGNKKFCENGKGFYAGTKAKDVNTYSGEYGNPWMLILTRESWFQKKVKDKWNAVSPTLTAEIPAFIDAMTEKYAKDYTANTDRWKNISTTNTVCGELNDTAKNCKSQAEAAAWLKTWLLLRFSGISTAWNGLTIPEN